MPSSNKNQPVDLDRRRLLKGAAGAMVLGSAPGIVHALGDPEAGSLFTLGVASGDPTPWSVVLWTRLAPDPLNGGGLGNRDIRVDIEVARDPGFRHVLRAGYRWAQARDGHVVNVLVRSLPPDTTLYYRFRAMGQVSRVGITRTFPRWLDSPDHVRFAVVSCQNYNQGFFTAYTDIVRQDVDFVIHTGDYIYEGGPTSTPIAPGRRHDGPEIFSVEDYRNRYALYRLDPDLQAAHAMVPFLVTWDDHEVENNYAGLFDENGSTPDDFLQRRTNAYQVYAESMPMRPRNRRLRADGELPIFRGLNYGDLANIYMLDTRQYRTDQPADDGFGSTDMDLSPTEAAVLEQVFGEQLFDPDAILDPKATLLGLKQEAWLAKSLQRSRAQWNILAQQIMVMEWNLATTGRLSAILGSFPEPLPPAVDALLQGLDSLYNVDAWDGYPAARQRLLQVIDGSGASNPVVVTGDIHSAWAANLLREDGERASQMVAAEFVCTSISSTFLSLDPRPTHEIVRRGVDVDNPHIAYFNGLFRGYALCDVDTDAWTTTFRAVGDIADLASDDPLVLVPYRDSPVQTDAVIRLQSGFREDNGRLETLASRPIPDLLPFLT